MQFFKSQLIADAAEVDKKMFSRGSEIYYVKSLMSILAPASSGGLHTDEFINIGGAHVDTTSALTSEHTALGNFWFSVVLPRPSKQKLISKGSLEKNDISISIHRCEHADTATKTIRVASTPSHIERAAMGTIPAASVPLVLNISVISYAQLQKVYAWDIAKSIHFDVGVADALPQGHDP